LRGGLSGGCKVAIIVLLGRNNPDQRGEGVASGISYGRSKFLGVLNFWEGIASRDPLTRGVEKSRYKASGGDAGCLGYGKPISPKLGTASIPHHIKRGVFRVEEWVSACP
jgi:hypothetical protein